MRTNASTTAKISRRWRWAMALGCVSLAIAAPQDSRHRAAASPRSGVSGGSSAASYKASSDAESDDYVTISLDLRVGARGSVTISAQTGSAHTGSPEVPEAGEVLDAVPAAFACDWLETSRDAASIKGVCRGWLVRRQGLESPRDSNSAQNAHLSLARAVWYLHRHGAGRVWIVIDAPNAAATPPAGWTPSPATGKPVYFTFDSADGWTYPPDLPVQIEGPIDYSRVVFPVVMVLLAPALIALVIRARALNAAAGQKVNWFVWMNWITLCAWLYWISALDLNDLGEMLEAWGISNFFASLAAGAAIYSLPPLAAIALSTSAMAPLVSSSRARFQMLLKRRIVAEATYLVPLGIFLVGAELVSSSMGYGAGAVSLVIAYVVYRGLAWSSWTMSYRETRPIESGELFERARELAKRAGVALAGLNLLRTRMPEEANAFASPGNRITLTESLVNGLTPREVDAVIAHELGHHKAGHTRLNPTAILFIVYVAVVGPLFAWLIDHYHLPRWFVTLPIMPLLFTMAQGLLSQRREFAADARAAEITRDPEGSIAALARLARSSRVPVESQGMMGSILSHPSMEKRVLTLARRNAIDDARALEILRDPDVAYARREHALTPIVNAASIAPPPLPALQVRNDSSAPLRMPGGELSWNHDEVYSLRAKVALHEQIRWLHLIAPLVGGCLLALPLAYLPFYPDPVDARWLLLLSAIPIFAFEIIAELAVLRRFALRIRRGISRKIAPPRDSKFVGLHPGAGVRFTEGLPEWDFGFLTLEGDWLCYRGEKARFAIGRSEVLEIQVIKGRKTWFRERRVQIRSTRGCFTIGTNFAYTTLADAERTARKLRSWLGGRGFASSVRPEPPPMLPPLPGMESSRLASAWVFLKIVFQLWIATTMLAAVATRNGAINGAAVGICMISAPLAVFVRMLPGMIWPIRRPRDEEMQRVETREITEETASQVGS